jgi:hypothetical protein
MNLKTSKYSSSAHVANDENAKNAGYKKGKEFANPAGLIK